jgi:hypothetical protein
MTGSRKAARTERGASAHGGHAPASEALLGDLLMAAQREPLPSGLVFERVLRVDTLSQRMILLCSDPHGARRAGPEIGALVLELQVYTG